MADAASRWALLASFALHAGAFALTLTRPARSVAQKATLTDFWAGSTFEVPEHLGDLAWESPESAAYESASEINVEGVDPSSPTRIAPIPTANPTANPTATPTPTPTKIKTGPSAGHPHAAARAASSASGVTGSSGNNGSASSGTFGADGAPVGVRDLVRSFVRAIPIVASSDPVWSTLPLGAAGSAEVTLGLDGEGKPFTAQPLESGAPAHLRRLVQKTLSVMSGGRFAMAASEGAPAEQQKLRIAVSLTQQEPPAEREVASGGAFGLRFEPPDAHHISRAFFTLASGRRVEVSVRPLSTH